jgi:ATP-dependent Clp protease ATP-binding subunit ClpC
MKALFAGMSERARRVFFFCRYEATQFGSSTIETEHLLLALIRADSRQPGRSLPEDKAEAMKRELEARRPVIDRIVPSADLALSEECKRIFAYAAERAASQPIEIAHLVEGIVREEKCLAAKTLRKHMKSA